jgi:hypothetical protein
VCPLRGLTFEDLVLQRLALEQALELTHPAFQLAHAAGSDDILVGSDRLKAALLHPPLPGKQQARRHPVPAGDEGHRQARLHRLFDQVDLLGGRPAPPALDQRDHLDARQRADRIRGHSRNHRRIPMSYRLCPLSGQTGGRPRDVARAGGIAVLRMLDVLIDLT